MSDTLKNVRTVSRILGWVCLIGVVFEICLVPLIWHVDGWIDTSASQMTISLEELRALSGWQKYAVMASMMLPTLVMAYGLWRLRKMFLSFAENHIFQPAPIAHLKAFSVALMAQTLIKPLSGALTSVLATITRPEGERMLSIGLSDAEASTLFLGGLLLVIAWVLGEATRIEDENRSFV
ncbi:Protein of unknown function [Thalassospira xiamenensis M-5 = DSM 17429]|uniref:DUF2975 domain-containing protein n=1 Tax=Thalassospira xiamenensis M-5 = DSM 17429 TaxID=1123366 RepID=A0AB72UAG8_9PROT|nr:DUF2975 domain-containing protein [Thalassospira xiamenensis]AJD51228.1 hypothetical protein TH3_05540 [Thalassospira xiamenensis M-5 = DSM 17429]SIT15830.1 Protein of unknown function [Thalassospira xiamenensis M-5 = DSM 17429]